MNRRGWVEPCVVSPRGTLTNHHPVFTDEGKELIGQRVKPEEASHFIVVAKPYGDCGPLVGELWTDVVPA